YGIPGTRSAAVDEALRAQSKSKGPMDRFVTSEARQSTLNSTYKQEERKEVCRKIGRFFFSRALPFNIVNDPFWLPMVEGIAAYGVGFKPPSMHELRTWILKEEVGDINTMMEEHKKAWAEYGCTIMSDGWTDGKNRVLINFLVNSPAGTWFLKSIDASDSIKNGTLLFKYLDDVVKEVGEEHVIQVITDNASNYKNAGVKLMEKRKKLWWTPCAAHCIDLMLEDISKMKVFEDTIRLAKQVVKFIYGHTWVLALMRSFTKNKEIIRPAITRFATSYLTLQSIYKQKQPLQAMFSSGEWHNGPFVQQHEGIRAHSTILYDVNFWSHVAFCIKSVIPLVSVLREVDSEERPAMGFIYELMDVAKEKIAFNCGKVERKYKPIWRRIDERWGPQLHQPLHAAGYYLNPQLRYEETFSNADEVRKGLEDCMTRMLSFEDRMASDIQLDLYDEAKGEFGSRLAVNSRKLRTPANWWKRFGRDTPELTKFAIRVLSLTCSASGCERNWSTFEQIHTKKRNRLEHQKLNALVYVKYNTALRERSIRRRSKIDPILVNEIESDDEWIAEVEEPILPTDLTWLNSQELYDVDVIRNMPTEPYETDLHARVPISVEPI
ncbi:PREDICTED: LOW QUALITY PROTEIN, partial [Prunus dulcis]